MILVRQETIRSDGRIKLWRPSADGTLYQVRLSLDGDPSGGTNAGNCGLPNGNANSHRSAMSCVARSHSGCGAHSAVNSIGVRK